MVWKPRENHSGNWAADTGIGTIDGIEAQRTAAAPTVWLLLDDRPGHATQVRGLARRLGWPAIEKPLRFNGLNRLPNPLLGASLASTVRDSRSALAPPFPDLVIGMGRRVLPVARWIKRAGGGRPRVVMLGRKAVDGGPGVDLHVGCHHFRLLPAPKLFELTVPPCQIDPEQLAQARAARPDPLQGLPEPHVVLLVGGPTAQHVFTPEFSARMVSQVAAAVARLRGSLAIVTSRRTPEPCIAAMREAAPAAHLHVWRGDRKDNPYVSYLANAHHLVATGESESMLAEAVATGLPVTIYPMKARPAATIARLAWRLREAASGTSWYAGIARALVERGWTAVPRDLTLMHRRMCDEGLARMFDGTVNTVKPSVTGESGQLTLRIRSLLAEPGEARP